MVEFSVLQGLVLKSVKSGDDEIRFETDSGRVFVMEHFQDCCESVVIESITGDLDDLVGTPILLAEEASSEESPPDYIIGDDEYEGDSQTWTFYKLRTIKGSVDIRWHGESNGYYSESVDFYEVDMINTAIIEN